MDVVAHVRINRVKSRTYARAWAAEHHVDPLAREIEFAAKREAPVRTGLLSRSIYNTRSEMALRVTRRVGSRVEYAHLVHTGARPHVITPRSPNGRLIFYWKKVNRVVSLKSVNHPGFKGVKYLQKPLVEYGTVRRFRVVIYATPVG